MTPSTPGPKTTVSIGIMAWNEEASIGPMLASLFGQSLFARLAARGECAEVVCLANGCTDRTVAVAAEFCAKMNRDRPARSGCVARVEDIATPGRNNAWNRFVHEFSAPETRFICLMDADIIFNRPDTLELVVGELERNPRLGGASDTPVKRLADPARPTLRERLSVATSEMTGTIAGRLNGMLYCLRAGIARNLYLPRDVLANDDGFFKAAICTDFFKVPLDPTKVVTVRQATHLYAPYLSLREVLNNQKRQMIGQATVHVIIQHLMTLPAAERRDLAATLRRLETEDPDWLKRLINAHVARTRHSWRLFPGILGIRWLRLWKMGGIRRVTHFPAAAAGFVVTLIACGQAARFLRAGVTHYWPKVDRVVPPAAVLPSPKPSPSSLS